MRQQGVYLICAITLIGCSGRHRDRIREITSDELGEAASASFESAGTVTPPVDDPNLSPDEIAFARLIEKLRQMPDHPTLGQPAPPFTVRSLDGDWFDLAEHLGQDVIVLDFWATWCGPCRKGLPKLASLAKQFDGQSVAVYAVNIGQDQDEVEKFLRANQVDLPVLLDNDGDAASLYSVHGIPQTVLIGRDGRVQVVHVGYSAQLEEMLAAELAALLKNVDFATALIAE